MIPMHGWHPVIIHLPLIAFAVAVLFDLVDAWGHTPRFRHAAHLLWGFAFIGAALAITSGLIAYGNVNHSEEAHDIMALHRNIALATVAALLIAAIWRWRRPMSKTAAVYSAVAFLCLLWVGYLGGELVFHHGVGIPTTRLEQIMHEREADAGEGHEHGGMQPMSPASDTGHVQK